MGKAFVWSEKYSVDVKLPDTHHNELFALMDKLNSVLMERRGREVVGDVLEVVGDVLNALLEYTVYHIHRRGETPRCREVRRFSST
jgi:hemerythrin